MSWLLELRLLHLFGFYLWAALVASTVMRIRQYRAILGLVGAFRYRWPKLLALVHQHGAIFLTWGTLLPLIMTLVLAVAQRVAYGYIWPDADLRVQDLHRSLAAMIVVAICGVAMLAYDIWGIVDVGEVNRPELEKYFDQAEHWLTTWKAPVLRIFTLGRINPRKMVAKEVKSALESASASLNYNLWWLAWQAGLRILFGLSLWISWAFLVD
jgi:hypothetical protein